MKVFKFGGASVKDAKAVKNVADILKLFPKENILVVVSAMGKITNALERLTDAIFYPAKNAGDKKDDASKILAEIKKYHFDIIEELFPSKEHPIYNEISNTFVELDWAVEDTRNYNFQ